MLIWHSEQATGSVETELDIHQLMGKRLRIIGSVLRRRAPNEKIAIKESFMTLFWHRVESAELKPVIDSVYPISKIDAACARMAGNQNTGKIVLWIT